MSVIFQSYENQIQRKQVEYEPGENIQDIFQKMVENNDIDDELGFQIGINDVIMVLKKDKTRKINPDDEVETLIQQSKQDKLELMLVCPNEEGAVLIQFLIDKKYCYFQNYVNKNDQLENFLNNLCKKISYQKSYELKVNGHKNNPKAPFEKKTIKQLMTSSNSQKIVIEINESIKFEGKLWQSKVIAKKIQKQQIKQQKPIVNKIGFEKKQQSLHKQQIMIKIENQGALDNNNLLINHSNVVIEQKKISTSLLQKSQKEKPSIFNYQPNQHVAQIGNLQEIVFEEVKNQKFLLSINFETNFGIRFLCYEVEITKTMKDILPNVLKILVQVGFDWDIQWKEDSDYKDKLLIFYDKQEYRKLDSKFMSLLSIMPKKTHNFHFQRLFQGG